MVRVNERAMNEEWSLCVAPDEIDRLIGDEPRCAELGRYVRIEAVGDVWLKLSICRRGATVSDTPATGPPILGDGVLDVLG